MFGIIEKLGRSLGKSTPTFVFAFMPSRTERKTSGRDPVPFARTLVHRKVETNNPKSARADAFLMTKTVPQLTLVEGI